MFCRYGRARSAPRTGVARVAVVPMSADESEFRFGRELANRLDADAWESEEGLLVLEAIARASLPSETPSNEGPAYDEYLLAKSNLERLHEMFCVRYEQIGGEVEELDFEPLVRAGLLADRPQDRQIDQIKHRARKYFLAGDLLAFCTLAQQVLELLSADLLERELVADDHRGRQGTRRLFETELSQPVREELLYRCGVVDGDTRRALQQGREFRNTIARDLRDRRTVHTIDGAIDEIERYVDALNRLYERKEGRSLLDVDS